MIETGPGTLKGNRIYFLDNLRTFMIFLVVLYHAGGVYEASGIWASFWLVDDPSTNQLAGILNLILDIFMMPTIFFIAGFFTPLSLRDKSGWDFIKSKFKRLIIPWVIAVLTLIPLYKVIFLYSRNLPQENWTTYFHWSNGIWSQNWLWFLPVLFLFYLLYLPFSKINLSRINLTLARAVGAVFVLGFIYSYSMAHFNLHGWTKIILIDFQNERLLIYFLYFLLGSLCLGLKTFDSDKKSKKFFIFVNCIAWIPLNMYIIVVLNFFMRPGQFIVSQTVDRFFIFIGFHLSILCMLYLLVATFRFYINKQGRLLKALNQSSYGVYIIHVIVVGIIALAMLNLQMPSIVKYLTLAVLAWVACSLVVYGYRNLIRLKLSMK